MSSELQPLLPVLEPPAAGWPKLQARLRRRPATARRWAALAAAALLLGAVLGRAGPAPQPRLPSVHGDPVMLALVSGRPGATVLGARAGATTVPLGDDGVIYLRVLVASP